MTNFVSQIIGEASVTDKTGAVFTTQHKLSLTLKDGPATEIGCEMSFTKNLGNYQSARFHVSLKAPSNLDTDSLDKTFEYVKTWVDDKLAAMIQEADETVK
jgi:hypothetical protein